MKRILFLLAASFAVAFGQAQSPAVSLQSFQWLQGEWQRTNTKPGRSGVEKWMMVSPTEMQGWGISMKGQDTAFVEKLKLVEKDGAVYYVADVPGNKEPVYFKVTAVSADGFTCENAAHDFPKMITYKREAAKLKAVISGNGKMMEYWFEKRD